MTQTYATADDVSSRMGRPFSQDEANLADTLLDDAFTLIVSRIPLINEYVATGRVNRDAVTFVLCNSVRRVMLNPAGYRSEQEGDYLYSRDAATASGQLNITADEWSMLGVKKAFTVQPAYEVHPTSNLTINDIAFRYGMDEYSI